MYIILHTRLLHNNAVILQFQTENNVTIFSSRSFPHYNEEGGGSHTHAHT